MKKILSYFLVWRILLFIIAALTVIAIPVFGNRFPYVDRVLEVTGLPNWLWAWGNFDGVHYLRLAQNGYQADFTQAFFPFFPLLIRVLAEVLPRLSNLDLAIYVDPKYFWAGLVLSNFFFGSALLVFDRLLRLDFSAKISSMTIIFLLVFPTAFYFGAIYSESLFLLLVVSCLYFLRQQKYWLAGICGALASATRVIGVFLLLPYLIEIYQEKKIDGQKLFAGLLIPLGLLAYMIFLKINFNDALYFLTSQPAFGAERTAGEIVLLPQVIYRYLKIFLTVSINSLAFWNAVLEFTFTILALGVLIWGIKKVRLSYLVFAAVGMFLPTLTGTLSSMPRYVLMGFLIFPYFFNSLKNLKKTNQKFSLLIFVFLALLEIVLVSLFVRGYWVA